MEDSINIRIKLSRVYKFKKLLIQELNELRKDLSTAIKNMYVSDSVPESSEFSRFFRDHEYITLNKIITEHITQLERPVSGETEEVYFSEVENLKTTIDDIVSHLSETVRKINKYIINISGGTEVIPVEKFFIRLREKIEKNIDREIQKEIKPDIENLKEKINFIYRYNGYSEIMGFLSNFEREVNLYLSQKGVEKLKKITEKQKEFFLSGVKEYLENYIKSKSTREKIIKEITQHIEEINVNRYTIHYSLPDIRKYFADMSKEMSKIDVIISNLESSRFITILITGIILFILGISLPFNTIIKELIAIAGLITAVYSFIDSAYFNKHYMKKFVKQVRENIKEEIIKSLDSFHTVIKNSIMKNFLKAENLAISVIKRETRTIKNFESYLVNLRNNVERHIINISTIKKEFEYEISEEN